MSYITGPGKTRLSCRGDIISVLTIPTTITMRTILDLIFFTYATIFTPISITTVLSKAETHRFNHAAYLLWMKGRKSL
ncbi:MAG: hypothetical protein WA364_19490 [Candidatus Nitrosopolaris sp.]